MVFRKDLREPHIFRDSYGSGMGIVWEAYHKGSHYWGSLKIPLNKFRSIDYPHRVSGFLTIGFLEEG